MAKRGWPKLPTGQDKRDHPDLFKWFESAAAKLGKTRDDVSKAALAATPAIAFGLLSWWVSADQDSPLRSVLAWTTIVAFGSTFVAWATAALRSRIQRQGISIFLQGSALVLSCLVIAIAMHKNWNNDASHRAFRYEQARNARAKEEAARAAEKKLEEDRQKEREAVRVAELECLKVREELIDRAKRMQRTARKALDDCKAAYAQELIPLKSEAERCKAAQDQLDSTKGQVSSANSKSCATGSIKKSR